METEASEQADLMDKGGYTALGSCCQVEQWLLGLVLPDLLIFLKRY